MKQLIFISALMLRLSVYGQAPKAFGYQAFVRDVSNNLLVNQNIGIRVNISDALNNGTVLFSELFTATTNSNGLVSIEIGKGVLAFGFWNAIDWSKGPYYVQLKIDPNGGNNYTIDQAEQLLSVPYTQYAQHSARVFSHSIGELFEGGIIFHLWRDTLGVEHGLIAEMRDLDSNISFSNENLTFPNSSIDGLANCNVVMTNSANAGTATELCLNSNNGQKSDWYLPSINELTMLYKSAYQVNLNSWIYGAQALGKDGFYYSSTVDPTNSSNVYGFDMVSGRIVSIPRQYSPGPAKVFVRAIRRF